MIATELSAIAIKECNGESHPAEVSPASSDPEKRLMGVPREIRDEILKLLLTKKAPVNIRFERYVDPWGRITGKLMREKANNDILDQQTLYIGPKNTTSILRVNKQACTEGTDILYGQNTFKAEDTHRFEEVFVKGTSTGQAGHKGIGSVNATKIRSLILEVPMAIQKEYLQEFDGQRWPAQFHFLNFICRQFPKLDKLVLKIWAARRRTDLDPRTAGILQNELVRCTIALLKTATIVTKFHPILRKAVWSRDNGFTVRSGYEDASLNVQLLPVGHAPLLSGKSVTRRTVFGNDYQAMSFVLASQQIRRISHKDIVFWLKMAKGHYKLADDATTSEAHPSEIDLWASRCHDGWSCTYDPFAEYDPENHAMAVARLQDWGYDVFKLAEALAE